MSSISSSGIVKNWWNFGRPQAFALSNSKGATMPRDLVLEGALSSEVDAMMAVCMNSTHRLPRETMARLQAKGWIDVIGDTVLVTIAGRTLVQNR